MISDDLESVLNSIKKLVPGAVEVYRRLDFVGVRQMPEGGEEEFHVEIRDAGPAAKPDIRYFATVRTQSGRVATGNPAESIHMALAIAHRGRLDQPLEHEAE